MTPDALRIEEAIQRSVPLVRLQQRILESKLRFDTICACLPATLAIHVRPGPLDETGWSLLAANASVAAKLRQLLPRVETALRESGLEVSAIRVKVQSGANPDRPPHT